MGHFAIHILPKQKFDIKIMNDFQDEENSEEIDSVTLTQSRAVHYDQEDEEFQIEKRHREYQSKKGEKVKRRRLYQTGRRVPPHYSYNHFYLANDQLPPQRSSLLFPTTKEIYMSVENRAKLYQLLAVQQKQYNVILDIKVHETGTGKVSNLLVVCVSCAHKLLMKYHLNKKLKQFRLTYFDNTHLHQNQKSLLLSKEFKYKIFIKELKIRRDIDQNMTIDELQKFLQKEYGISQKQFRKFFYALQERYDHEMTSLLRFLRSQASRIWACTHQQLPSLMGLQQLNEECGVTKDPQFFMLSLDYMQDYCKLFSKILSINILPGFIQRKAFPVKRWEIITFSGLNHFADLVPFAFAFLCQKDDSIHNLTNIVGKFIKQFDVSPEVIITPYSEYYAQLINNFKSQSKINFLHIYDALCHIDTIGEELEDPANRIYFQDVILSKTKPQFAFRCETLLKKVEPTKKTMEIFNKMVQIAPKMCFGLIQTHGFLGLTFRYSANKYILNLTRQVFTKETARQGNIAPQQPLVRRRWRSSGPSLVKSVFLIVRAALRYNRDVISGQTVRGGYCQWRGEAYIGLPELQNIRINIKRIYLNLIYEEYGKIFYLDAASRKLKDQSLKEMRTFDVYDRRLKSMFVVSPYPVYGANGQVAKIIWKCNCCYSLKCGLPCSHQIKVAVVTDTSIFDQIHQLWLKKRVFAENLKRRGRTKGTRRNTQK